MSRYVEIDTPEFRDCASLVQALKDIGYAEVETGDRLPLYGYHGDMRPETAEVVVRRRYVGSASNDLGFARQTDGAYKMIVSEYDRARVASKLIDLRQRYTVNATMRILAPRGYRQHAVEKLQDGTLKVVVRGG